MEDFLMSAPTLFNSPLETGVRSTVLLDCAYPRTFDLKELTWLDHLVVHTGDLNGPESLHPNVPHRDGELIVRRSLVESGLVLMQSLHLVEKRYTRDGIVYGALEDAGAFVILLRSEYSRLLKSRAEWLIRYLTERGSGELNKVITKKIGRWSVEFQVEANLEGRP